MDVAIYIPSYNDSEAAAQTVASCQGHPVVVVDNHSDIEHRDRLRSLACMNVQVLRHNTNIGRVANWAFCVQHFLGRTRHDWLKIIMAGDQLRPGGIQHLHEYTSRFPEARLIISQVVSVSPGEPDMTTGQARHLLLEPLASLQACVEHGNIFHSLTAATIHRDHAAGYWGLGALEWMADALYLLHVATNCTTHFVPGVVMDRHEEHRRTFQALVRSPRAKVEEELFKTIAAEWSRVLTNRLTPVLV